MSVHPSLDESQCFASSHLLCDHLIVKIIKIKYNSTIQLKCDVFKQQHIPVLRSLPQIFTQWMSHKKFALPKIKTLFSFKKRFSNQRFASLLGTWELHSGESILKLQVWFQSLLRSCQVRFEVADKVAYVAEFVMAHNPFIQQGKAIPNNIRGQIVDRWLDGTGQRQIGRDLNIPKSTVQNICR